MRYDAVVVGGSFAGLSAALHIARARRSVCVVDAGSPRNRFADHSHGVFGHDGVPPKSMIAEARAQLQLYPTVRLIHGEADAARSIDDGFEIMVKGGERLRAAGLVLAFSVSDILPEKPGLAERWGKSVLHCPYCHGYEFAGQRLGVLHAAPASAHHAMLVADWGPTTLYLDGADMPDGDLRARLGERGVAIEPSRIEALVGADGGLSSLLLADGRRSPLGALYVAPRSRLNSALADQLGCAFDEGPLGRIIRTDEKKRTTVPGVYAAGDIARAQQNATWAAADGVAAGVFLHQSLIFGAID